MPRTKNTVAGRARRKRVLNKRMETGRPWNTLSHRAQTLDRAAHSYRDRKQRKRHFRSLYRPASTLPRASAAS